jgi:hypothetical protein
MFFDITKVLYHHLVVVAILSGLEITLLEGVELLVGVDLRVV